MSKRKKIDPELSKPIGPLVVEPCQWDQGASIVICHRERGVIAKIESINDGCDEYIDMDTAEREPYDLAYAHLFKAAPDMLAALQEWTPWGNDLAATLEFVADSRDRDAARDNSIECLSPYLRKIATKIRAAIAKTTPEPL